MCGFGSPMRFEGARAARRRARAWLLLLVCCSPLAALAGAGAAVPESDMKAAFVFNFAVFTEWPQEVLTGGAPISLCASASSAMFASLSQLNDKMVNGHRVAVRTSATSVRSCHVLVLERADRERWGQLKRDLSGTSVLTVADDRAIGADGAVIAMSTEEQRIGFSVDLAAVRAARLTLSSKLLRLARSVQ